MKLKLFSYYEYNELAVAYVEQSRWFGLFKSWDIYTCQLQTLEHNAVVRIGPWRFEETDKLCSPKLQLKLDELLVP